MAGTGKFDLRDGVLVELTAEEVAMLQPPAPPPAEVAMHKVEKAAVLTPWPGHANLNEAIDWAIDQMPEPKRTLSKIEKARAPNLVRDGLTTTAVMELIGMSEAQRDDLLNFAASLA